MERTKSKALFSKAQQYFPGGVNSPVRAFKAVGGNPLFIEKGSGPHIFDADGNRFIDFCGSFGPLILGHAHAKVTEKINRAIQKGTTFGAPTALENELAGLILSNHRYLDKIRFVNSGTEAVMSAIRLARGYTGRNKIVKFEGCYHGHVDSLLVNAGSGLATLGTSSSAGVPGSFVKETIVLPLNDREAVETAVKKYKGEIACIVIEPVPANNGLLIQSKEYLQFLRDTCDRENILLFFDEVISGFRIGFEGAAGHYGIQPDLLAFGKIIGGGLPVGAYGAKDEIMKCVAPEGPVYQAGTLSGNPVAMAAGIAQLQECLTDNFYERLAENTAYFASALNDFLKSRSLPVRVLSLASIFWISFSGAEEIHSAAEINTGSMDLFTTFYNNLLEEGVYLGPSGFEVGFVSQAHSKETIDEALEKMKRAFERTF